MADRPLAESKLAESASGRKNSPTPKPTTRRIRRVNGENSPTPKPTTRRISTMFFRGYFSNFKNKITHSRSDTFVFTIVQ